MSWRRFKFLPHDEYEALSTQQKLDYVAAAFDALKRAVATQPLSSERDGSAQVRQSQQHSSLKGVVRMPTAARNDPPNAENTDRPVKESSFTWLSADAFQRLTPAMKDEYVRQLAANFGLEGDAGLRE